MPISLGDRLGPYEIRARIGAGGMGEVYNARDTRLNRDVAIKVLPGHLENDPDSLARFKAEALAVAALSHPNVLVLYDIGSQDGITWAVTELLEGETLRERLDRSAIPWRRAAEIGAAVAEGLAAAHARGIVHRDIKPANIFITADGRVKILDFGLAVRNPFVSSDEKTATHVVLEAGSISGTIGYMSPEQLRAEKVDAASDIFSLGCVLLEMVTGERPFQGQSATDRMSAILREEPAESGGPDKVASPELERIIARCLKINPSQRFHSAKDLAFALESISSSSTSSAAIHPSQPVRRGRSIALASAAVVVLLAGLGFYRSNRASDNIDSLAVLPFVNASGNGEADWLSDGITTSLIDSLSGMPNLKVMSQSAVFRYKGKDADPHTAGRGLDVRAVLVGRLMQRGDSLTVSAELVRVADNSQIWGEVYNRKVMDAMSVQQDIVTQIAGKLRARLTKAQITDMKKGQTDNAEAYQLYLKGRYYAAKFDFENLTKGLGFFKKAIELDPNYALAYDGLAYYYELVEDLYFAPKDVMPRGGEAARKAVAIDESIAESHVELGSINTFFDFDWANAEKEFKRAIELNPNYPNVHEYYSWYLMSLNRPTEAVAESRRAEALDPLSAEIAAFTPWWLFEAHRYDEAVAVSKKCLDLNADYPICGWILGEAYMEQGKFDAALAAENKVLQNFPTWGWVLGDVARIHALSGHRAEAEEEVAALISPSNKNYVSKYSVARVYAGLGDKSRALEWLEKAFEDKSFFFDFVQTDPQMDGLRSEPRFQALVRAMKFPGR
jgi:eukaryotic-like serine/threonine-protein kinase